MRGLVTEPAKGKDRRGTGPERVSIRVPKGLSRMSKEDLYLLKKDYFYSE